MEMKEFHTSEKAANNNTIQASRASTTENYAKDIRKVQWTSRAYRAEISLSVQ